MALYLLFAIGSVLLVWLGSVCVYLSLLYAYGNRQRASGFSEHC